MIFVFGGLVISTNYYLQSDLHKLGCRLGPPPRQFTRRSTPRLLPRPPAPSSPRCSTVPPPVHSSAPVPSTTAVPCPVPGAVPFMAHTPVETRYHGVFSDSQIEIYVGGKLIILARGGRGVNTSKETFRWLSFPLSPSSAFYFSVTSIIGHTFVESKA